MEFYIKLTLALLLLLYASLLDWRYREINEASWLGLLLLGAVFALAEYTSSGSPSPILHLLISTGITAALIVPVAYLGLMGGGDAKILLGIAAVFPAPPADVVTLFPLFSLSVFANAIVLSLALPLFFFIKNLRHIKDVRSFSQLYALFLGYKKHSSEIKPYEAVYGDGRKFSFILRTDAELGKAEKEGEVWVTPAVPFVIPITLGVLMSALYGDLLSAVLLFLRGS
ncbi:prepilin peptidase [Candidatus Pyrohabitans sp.]